MPRGQPRRAVTFGRYQLLSKLASGGMATLYLARLQGPEQFEKLLVIKKIHDHLAEDPTFIDMFFDEARLAAKIDHPNVATIFDLGRHEGAYFIAMEYIHGYDLSRLLMAAQRRERILDWALGVRILADAAAGLHAAHELRQPGGKLMGVVHRDISPQNILLGFNGHVKIVDFGVALAAERISTTEVGALKGKRAYMSPEQVSHLPIDRRSDLFSLGVVLFETICQRRLFHRERGPNILAQVKAAKVPPPGRFRDDLPQGLARIIKRALARRPGARFQTAAELQEALEDLLVAESRRYSQRQVADVMTELLAEARLSREDVLSRAIGEEATRSFTVSLPATQGPAMTGPGPGAPGRAPGASASGTTMAWHSQAPVARQPLFSKPLAIVAGFVAAGLVVALVLALARTKPEPPRSLPTNAPRAPRAGAAAMASAAPVAKTVEVVVSVRPATTEAIVRYGNRAYRGPNVHLALPRSSSPATLVIGAPGYEPQTHVVIPQQDHTLRVQLQPKPVPPRATPPPRRTDSSVMKRPVRRGSGRARPRPRAASRGKLYRFKSLPER